MMLEVQEIAKDIPMFIDVKVKNPSKESGSYVTYEIVIETNDPSFTHPKSSTRRRYSDFTILNKILAKQLPYNKLPIFPPKEPFKNSFDSEFIGKRQEALQDFLKQLLSDRVFLSSKALHLFLQSSFTMAQIKDINDGKLADDIPPDSSLTVKEETNEISPNESTDACAILIPSSETNVNTSSIDTKRVSFSDQVTVAEVHIT